MTDDSLPRSAEARIAEEYATVEQLVRAQLSKALGGVRGMIEGAVPTVAFTISWLTSRDLQLSLIISVGLAALLVLVRLVQRQTVQFVLNSLVGIGIGALFAMRSGEAKDVFLPGILYNGAYGAVMVISVLVGWPLVGFLLGTVTGDPTGWHADKPIVRLCAHLTWVLAAPCVLRVLVQYPLYAADQLGWLATAKIVMGWPLQVAALALMAFLLGRNHTPLASTREAS
ncbi:MAG: DUF3159 domain-containing protein [Nocardioidaceae bacterium]